MKKITITALFVLILSFGILSVGTQAASVDTTKKNYGYMVPTNSTFEKTVSSVKLYGSYDYINFYIDSEYGDTYFFFEIYSDKNYENLVYGDYCVCDSGNYTYSPIIKLKDNFKTGTYYCVTYAASVNGDSAKISLPSMVSFEIKVDRNPDYSERVVILKDTVNTVNGPKITWNKLTSSTDKYYVYRRSVTGTKWTKVGTVNGTTYTFTDKSIKDKNGAYVYSVKGVDGDTTSRRHYSGITAKYAVAPVITSVKTVADNKVEIKWKSTDASYYKIYRKTNGGEWESIYPTIEKNSYTTGSRLKNNTKYEFMVRAYKYTKSGTAVSAYYSGKTLHYLSAPTLNRIEVADKGLNISWSEVDGAVNYSVLRKPLDSKEKWTVVKKVSGDVTSYNDKTASADGGYLYTVRSEGKSDRGSYKGNGVEYFVLAQPEFSVKTDKNGIHITWEKVPYAKKYQVCYMGDDGTWKFTNQTSKLYMDISPTAVQTSKYSVRARRSDVKGPFEKNVESVTFFPRNSPTCVIYTDYNRIKWNDVKADSYNLYRKAEGDSSYKLIYSGKKLSYLDKNVEYDVAYTYTVKAVVDSLEQSDNLTYITKTKYRPEKYIESFRAYKEYRDYDDENDSSGYYYCFDYSTYSTKGKSITRYFYGKSGWRKVSYGCSVSALKPGSEKPKFSLMVSDSKGSTPLDGCISYVEDGMCAKPTVKFTPVKNGLKISWNSVKNASGFRLYLPSSKDTINVKADGSKSYSLVIDNEKIDVGIPEVSFSTIHTNGNKRRSYFEPCYIKDIPEMVKVSSNEKDNFVSWYVAYGFNSEVHQYAILRKAPGDKSWTKIATVNGEGGVNMYDTEYYYDKSAKPGVKYKYTVRVVIKDSNQYASYYDTAGLEVGKIGTPKIISVTNASKGINLKWRTIGDTSFSYIYRKTADSKWIKIGTVKDLYDGEGSYTDKTAKSGVTYYYKIKSKRGNYSSDSSVSVSIKRLTTPVLKTPVSSKSGITVKWEKVTGAEGYIVYRKAGSGKWVKLATVKGNSKVSYLDKTAEKGKTYSYSVRAYSGDSVSLRKTEGVKIKDKY